MHDADRWTIEIFDPRSIERLMKGLTDYERTVLQAAVDLVLARRGISVCESSWGKSLGGGLFEFRVRKSLHALHSETGRAHSIRTPGDDREVLLRLFCTFYGTKIVLLLSGYDKRSDASRRRQQAEIAHARRLLKSWQRAQQRS